MTRRGPSIGGARWRCARPAANRFRGTQTPRPPIAATRRCPDPAHRAARTPAPPLPGFGRGNRPVQRVDADLRDRRRRQTKARAKMIPVRARTGTADARQSGPVLTGQRRGAKRHQRLFEQRHLIVMRPAPGTVADLDGAVGGLRLPSKRIGLHRNLGPSRLAGTADPRGEPHGNHRLADRDGQAAAPTGEQGFRTVAQRAQRGLQWGSQASPSTVRVCGAPVAGTAARPDVARAGRSAG